ncbi:MAG: hypothetical protein Hyperionvirus7_77 [Hyperionvirus sp.]|uniref:DUF4214 domain-containing protein n=1 Tax=Hyperionvirus sp. TaxID=2487770 RepID=A0A3G5A8A4_9VIRU|nr:MAG: hypothetical protein Hyperionvirus7_77 [Hyperionvirus sp.]
MPNLKKSMNLVLFNLVQLYMTNNIQRLIRKVYRQLLFREPDKQGYNHWFSLLYKKKLNEITFTQAIKSSDEYKKLPKDPREFIKFAYRSILKRDGDEKGIEDHMNMITGKLIDRDHIADNFYNNDEHKKNIIMGMPMFHADENAMISELIPKDVKVISWARDPISSKPLEDTWKLCDCIVIPLGWEKFYLEDKPFISTICDRFSPDVILNTSKHRNFRGYISVSVEWYDFCLKHQIPCLNILRKYAYTLTDVVPLNISCICRNVVSLINLYQSRLPVCYEKFQQIKKRIGQKFNVEFYDAFIPGRGIDDKKALLNARYLLHVKRSGHVCNAVVKALALGVPVIMDTETYEIGRYRSYIKHGLNGIVFKNVDELIKLMLSNDEESMFIKMKNYCLSTCADYHLPHTDEKKGTMIDLAN